MSTKHCVLATTFCIFSACNIKVKSCKYFWFYRLCKELKENQKKVLEIFLYFLFLQAAILAFIYLIKSRRKTQKSFLSFFLFFLFFFLIFLFFFFCILIGIKKAIIIVLEAGCVSQELSKNFTVDKKFRCFM